MPEKKLYSSECVNCVRDWLCFADVTRRSAFLCVLVLPFETGRWCETLFKWPIVFSLSHDS